MATARAVKTTAIRLAKKARGSRMTRVRAMRVMTETSPREEGDDGHNNQLGTKAVAMARTVVVTTAMAIMMAARAMATEVKRTMAMTAMVAAMATTAMMVMMVMLTPISNNDVSGNEGNEDTKRCQ